MLDTGFCSCSGATAMRSGIVDRWLCGSIAGKEKFRSVVVGCRPGRGLRIAGVHAPAEHDNAVFS
eukprot:15484991-Alexandrium_andersonii.AAC.1